MPEGGGGGVGEKGEGGVVTKGRVRERETAGAGAK